MRAEVLEHLETLLQHLIQQQHITQQPHTIPLSQQEKVEILVQLIIQLLRITQVKVQERVEVHQQFIIHLLLIILVNQLQLYILQRLRLHHLLQH